MAGLVPATSPWKDLLPTPARIPHADNADLADDSLCEISEISVSKKCDCADEDRQASPADGGRQQAGHYTKTMGNGQETIPWETGRRQYHGDLCALNTRFVRNENRAALVLKSGCSGISVVAGLVPATSPWKDLLPTPAKQSLPPHQREFLTQITRIWQMTVSVKSAKSA